ncbi:MAG: hypothetical protein OEL78_00045 [Hyphomicrobiales bacterium]|nr:hypothetical protein [Hyphomicrobiales bacterium]
MNAVASQGHSTVSQCVCVPVNRIFLCEQGKSEKNILTKNRRFIPDGIRYLQANEAAFSGTADIVSDYGFAGPVTLTGNSSTNVQ